MCANRRRYFAVFLTLVRLTIPPGKACRFFAVSSVGQHEQSAKNQTFNVVIGLSGRQKKIQQDQ
jgi:hypothetical protein